MPWASIAYEIKGCRSKKSLEAFSKAIYLERVCRCSIFKQQSVINVKTTLCNLSQIMQFTMNWMAWCKRDVSDFFRWNFLSFKSAWIFACAFQLSRKTFSCMVFLAEMLLFCFVVFIVHASIFCLCFSQKQSANQAKKYRGMLCYLIEKNMQKFKHFWRKKNFTWKSHLRPSCTKPFNYYYC